MGSRAHQAVATMLDAIERPEGDVLVSKTMWGSPAGKKRIAERLAKLLPAHTSYVEPFAGSAAVLFAKQASETEAINDADPEIARAYKVVQKLREPELARLSKLSWTGDERTFHKLVQSTPTDDLSFLYKFLYTTHFSYGKMRGKSFSPSSKGIEAKTVARLAKFAPRLRTVKVFSGDYEPVVRKFDGKKTAMFLDPPYAGYDARVGEKKFDERRFFDVLKGIQGKWVLTYGIRGELPKLLKGAGFDVRTIRTRRTISAMRGVGGPSVLTQLLATNFTQQGKALAPLADAEDLVIEPFELAPSGSIQIDRVARLVKGADPADERFVLGVVLEPETVDAQGDIYSEQEVRKAAHHFLEEFGALGFMHRLQVNGAVKVLESYLAPADAKIGDSEVKKGTWLLGIRVLSDELWSAVRDETITGFSIGGSARRVPDSGADAAETEAA